MIRETPPPHNRDAERQLISCALLDLSSIDEVFSIIDLPDVYFDHHRRILAALKAMHDRGEKAASETLVIEELRSRDELAEIGDPKYVEGVIREIIDKGQYRTDYAEQYAKVVRKDADRRRLLHVAQRLAAGIEGADDVPELIAKVEAELFAVAAGGQVRDLHISQALDPTLAAISERMDAPDGIAGISTGLGQLDDLIGGLQKSRLVVIAARPGVGKTALVCGISLGIARRARAQWEATRQSGEEVPTSPPGGVLMVSLEMPRTEIVERLISMEGRISSHTLARGKLDEIDCHALNESSSVLRDLPLFIDDNADSTMSRIEAICRREARRQKLGLIVVDHIGIIKPEDRRNFNLEAHTAMVSRRLKVIASTLEIPVVALCQMNRDFEKREDKRPKLSDLRSSGAIEQDADIVIFVNRPELYDSDVRKGEADLVIAKNRSGRLGVAELVWRSAYMQFADKVEDTVAGASDWGDS